MAYVGAGPQAGTPLLMLHGFTDSSRSWSLVARHLQDRRLILPDLRGHGATGGLGLDGFDPVTLAGDILGLMDALGIDQADVAGHSLGAMTATALAAFWPGRVRRLTLAATALAVPKAALDWLWATLPSLTHPLEPGGDFIRDWCTCEPPAPAPFMGRLRAEVAALPQSTWLGVLRSLTIADLTCAAAMISAPTLVLWGARDVLFDLQSQERLGSALQSADREAFPEAGHNLIWEIPQAVAVRIGQFLGP